MKEQIISFETAKLAKEKGFEAMLLTYYDSETEELQPITATVRRTLKSATGSPYGQNTQDDYEAVLSDMDNSLDEFILAPTQSFLQKWLREKYGIHIKIEDWELEKWYFILRKMRDNHTNVEEIRIREENFEYPSYEKALERGLQEALNLIK